MLRYVSSFIVLIVTLFLLGGCASSMGNQETAKFQAKEGKSMLVVYRPHNDFWRKGRYSIYINGVYEQMLANGFYFRFEKEPGSYVVELKEDAEYDPEVLSLNIDARAGRTYYLRFGTANIESHPDFKEVRPSTMRAEEHLIRKGF